MGCTTSKPPATFPVFPFKGHEGQAWITHVVDGDTVDLILQVQNVWIGARARLFGIDAAEKKTTRGPAATAELQRLLRPEKVWCQVHPTKTDKYGRLLVTLFHNEVNLNHAMCEYRHPQLGQVCWPYDGGKKSEHS